MKEKKTFLNYIGESHIHYTSASTSVQYNVVYMVQQVVSKDFQ